jgi:16S rRNA G1207 methylase RsmC
MNPPFAQGADIEHISHALRLLKPGGRLAALCANEPRQNASLRPMVEVRGGKWETPAADTFKSEGTGMGPGK